MNPSLPPEIAPLDEARLVARQAHLERELARSPARAPRRRLVRGGIVVAAGLAAAGVLLAGRGGGPDALAKARAAVSRGPYLGIVIHTPPSRSALLVHLSPASLERVHYQAEVWFDTRKHGPAATIGECTRIIGSATRSGCIGVAFSYADSTIITGSIDHYRAALASGRVHKVSSAIVRGRRAWWLRFTPDSRPPAVLRNGWASYIAVDQKTGDPLRFEARKGGQVRSIEDIDVLPETHALPSDVKIETVAQLIQAQRGLSLRPGRRHERSGSTVTLAQASAAVPDAVWPGETAAGQPFRQARVLTLDNGAKQLELAYGGPCPRHCLLIKQGTESGWAPGEMLSTVLPDRSILVNGFRYANGRAGALRIRIEGNGRAGLLATARALRPLRP
jgi:hypothetical protein